MRSTVGERILVALNKASSSRRIKIQLPQVYRISGATDLLNSAQTDIQDSRFPLEMSGSSWQIWLLTSGTQ
jgi:hypothetical protein